jgi:hypothetical protein
LIWLAAGCVLLGVFPVTVMRVLEPVNALLIGRTASPRHGQLAAVGAPSIPTDRATAR